MVLYNVVKKLVAGLGNLIPAGTKLTLNGVSYTLASRLAQLNGYISSYDNVAQQKHQYQVAVAQLKAATPDIRSLKNAVGLYLRGQLGPAGAVQLEKLGLKSGARKNPASALEKAQAQETSKATKKVRGIIGKKQRALIPAAPKVQLLGPDRNPIQSSGSAPSAPAASPGANGSNLPSGK